MEGDNTRKGGGREEGGRGRIGNARRGNGRKNARRSWDWELNCDDDKGPNNGRGVPRTA